MKVLLSIFMITVVIFTSSVRPASANPAGLLAVIGGVEIGTLALWGGAILVASAGTAVGLDPDLMDKVEGWGKSTYNNAHQTIKDEISASVAAMKSDYSTAQKYAVKWSAATEAYLRDTWVQAFGSSTTIVSGTVMDGMYMFPFSFVPNYLTTGIYYALIEHKTVNGDITFTYYNFTYPVDRAIKITDSGFGDTQNYEFRTRNTEGFNYPTKAYYPYTATNVAKMEGTPGLGWSIEGFDRSTPSFQYVNVSENATLGSYARLKYANFEITTDTGDVVFTPSTMQMTYPMTFPDTVYLPAPRGTVVDNEVTYDKPTIGVVGGVLGGDIAVGYPAVAGNVGALTQADSIAVSTTVPPVSKPGDTGTGNRIPWGPMLLLGVFLDFLRAILYYLVRLLDYIVTLVDIPSRPLSNVGFTYFMELRFDGEGAKQYFGNPIPVDFSVKEFFQTMLTFVLSLSVYKILRRFF